MGVGDHPVGNVSSCCIAQTHILSCIPLSCRVGLLDIVFDWYSLTLANTVIAWRKGFTGHVSTFVHSAQRVSGTTERTIIGAPIGHG
jgi:hypothetical protein